MILNTQTFCTWSLLIHLFWSVFLCCASLSYTKLYSCKYNTDKSLICCYSNWGCRQPERRMRRSEEVGVVDGGGKEGLSLGAVSEAMLWERSVLHHPHRLAVKPATPDASKPVRRRAETRRGHGKRDGWPSRCLLMSFSLVAEGRGLGELRKGGGGSRSGRLPRRIGLQRKAIEANVIAHTN